MNLKQAILSYQPFNGQEKIDQETIQKYLQTQENLLTRENEAVHFTASAWIVNPEWTKTVMVYHHIYDSWSWVGGHADGEANLLKVAEIEAKEETGLTIVKPVSDEIFSLEVLSVKEHWKKGKLIPEHLHLNLTFLFEAPEHALTINPEENSAVAWILLTDVVDKSSEPEMKPIYQKLNDKLKTFSRQRGTETI